MAAFPSLFVLIPTVVVVGTVVVAPTLTALAMPRARPARFGASGFSWQVVHTPRWNWGVSLSLFAMGALLSGAMLAIGLRGWQPDHGDSDGSMARARMRRSAPGGSCSSHQKR